jgi:squalene synthase HpnC
VASRLLPDSTREHLLAFYGFARLVDEVGDTYQGDRLAALDRIEDQTKEALADGRADQVMPAIAAATRSVRALDIDPEPLFLLIAANRQDQIVSTYETYEDLIGYCALSANPIGRLALAAFHATSDIRIGWSDSICSGLQLAEHWQDVAEDAAAGRIYLPQEDLRRFGLDPAELTAMPPAGPQLRGLLMFEVWRARQLLNEGAALIRDLPGRHRWAVAGFWAGGHAALDAIVARRFDVLGGAPRRSRRRTAALAFGAVTGHRKQKVAG